MPNKDIQMVLLYWAELQLTTLAPALRLNSPVFLFQLLQHIHQLKRNGDKSLRKSKYKVFTFPAKPVVQLMGGLGGSCHCKQNRLHVTLPRLLWEPNKSPHMALIHLQFFSRKTSGLEQAGASTPPSPPLFFSGSLSVYVLSLPCSQTRSFSPAPSMIFSVFLPALVFLNTRKINSFGHNQGVSGFKKV